MRLLRMTALVRMLANEINQVQAMDREVASAVDIEQDLAPPALEGDRSAQLAALARRYAKLRLKRGELFVSNLFADPAWDMLIDLFAAAHEGRVVTVTSVCIAAAVPSTTALRWLSLIEREGLVARKADPADKRRTIVRITPLAEQAMAIWFGHLMDSPLGRIVGPPAAPVARAFSSSSSTL